jgi:predicted nucleotidyltransferase
MLADDPAELGAFVQGHLSKKGIEVVLSGGTSVAIYTNSAYVSKDVDLVNIHSVRGSSIRAAMLEIDS